MKATSVAERPEPKAKATRASKAKAAATKPAAQKPAELPAATSWGELSESGQAFYRRSETALSEDLDYAANKLAVDVAFALAEELEDFDGFDPAFRRGLQRAARRALLCVFRSEKRVVVLPEALPGYTFMAFKKEAQAKGPAKAPAGAAAKALPACGAAEHSLEGQAAARIVGEYMKTMSDSRVIAIESADAVLALFPAADTRRNLREMGLVFAGLGDD
jgi:hypothetical protein